MGESFDIQNLLQTGYFTTNRAKSPKPTPALSDLPKYTPPAPPDKRGSRTFETTSRPRPRKAPPPPSVEDEAISLKREHGAPNISKSSDEEPPSRGDIEQNPVIIEVHEYNPERRFVILTDAANEVDEGDHGRKDHEHRPPLPERPRDDRPRDDRPRDDRPRDDKPRDDRPRDDGLHETTGRRKDESKLKAATGSGPEANKPHLERRKSRQDLPRLETERKPERAPEHHRSRSSVNNNQPDLLSARQPRPYAEQLPPEVIKHGNGGREKVYHGYGQPQSASTRIPMQRSYSNLADENHVRVPPVSDSSKRSNSNIESGKSTRRRSNERMEPRYRPEYTPAPSRNTKKDKSPPNERSDRDPPAHSSTHPPRDSTTRREDGRPVDEYPKGPREPTREPATQRRRKSVVIQEGRDSLSNLGKTEGSGAARIRPRGPTMPLPVPTLSGFPDAAPPNPRPSATFPVTNPGTKVGQPPPERPKVPPPYPVDDDPMINPFNVQSNSAWPGKSPFEAPPISMPDLPPPIPMGHEPLYEPRSGVVPPTPSHAPATTQSWQPPVFDPERDGVHLERPVGSFRRYSESAGSSDMPKFPECRRKVPVAGLMDWLTLPRTDFNICPDCYGAVFANTEYRTQFQPMLRPSDRKIACDFSLTPWYRIAWLLTLKNEKPDLRVFHQIANIISGPRSQPCPDDRPAVRNWLTIQNPYTLRPVYDFAVCSQCASVIEALLPNLAGTFVPLDPRTERTRATCAMRYTPKRKRFVTYFDAMETTSDQAFMEKEPPDIQNLALDLEKITVTSECHEDSPIHNGYWQTMQYLPQFSVCGECFDEVVRPRLDDDNVIARNFYTKPQRLPVATCQLYSTRMREIFKKACRWNDPKYLEAKVLERMNVEAVIHDKLKKVDRPDRDPRWVEEQVDNLIQEWKKWE
ncbi:hypothetical protein G7046_g2029 [Stylonectria norvegica]|nr:hypothetical protein G7046_g2029 [Stylonectria norvegica]